MTLQDFVCFALLEPYAVFDSIISFLIIFFKPSFLEHRSNHRSWFHVTLRSISHSKTSAPRVAAQTRMLPFHQEITGLLASLDDRVCSRVVCALG